MAAMELMFILSNLFPLASYQEFSKVTFFMFRVGEKENLNGYSIYCAKGQECYNNKYSCWILDALSSTQNTLYVLEILKNLAFLFWLESIIYITSKMHLGASFCHCIYSFTLLVIAFLSFSTIDRVSV